MIGIEISFGMDELEPDGSECIHCKEKIEEGKMIALYTQVGNPEDAKYQAFYHEECFKERWGD